MLTFCTVTINTIHKKWPSLVVICIYEDMTYGNSTQHTCSAHQIPSVHTGTEPRERAAGGICSCGHARLCQSAAASFESGNSVCVPCASQERAIAVRQLPAPQHHTELVHFECLWHEYCPEGANVYTECADARYHRAFHDTPYRICQASRNSQCWRNTEVSSNR